MSDLHLITHADKESGTHHKRPGATAFPPGPLACPAVIPRHEDQVALRVGAGRREAAILAALDGQALDFRELASEITGHEPTKSEYVALSRAAHNLAADGMLQFTRVPRGTGGGAGPPRVYLLKVSRWVTGSDAVGGTDAEAPPVGSGLWLNAAFGTPDVLVLELPGAVLPQLGASQSFTNAEV